eukprot:TRINITY_DN18801_c0_g1_i1.p1 TRINITY_DN18801_c0_g1~~TRINITY_DN18801_c0_g1_i1.p1  ORF type:complete len:203 (+),score=-4.42 TRINITY_DN18801_c0_g1_i1:469-1077(+)
MVCRLWFTDMPADVNQGFHLSEILQNEDQLQIPSCHQLETSFQNTSLFSHLVMKIYKMKITKSLLLGNYILQNFNVLALVEFVNEDQQHEISLVLLIKSVFLTDFSTCPLKVEKRRLLNRLSEDSSGWVMLTVRSYTQLVKERFLRMIFLRTLSILLVRGTGFLFTLRRYVIEPEFNRFCSLLGSIEDNEGRFPFCCLCSFD